MANFEVHLGMATIGGGVVSAALYGAHIITPGDTALCWAAASAGGILPDIDLATSSASKNIFTGFGIIGALSLVIGLNDRFGILLVCVCAAALYCVIRYGGKKLFAKMTAHRGIFHSILAAGFFGVVVIDVGSHIGLSEFSAWMIGSFVCLGFVIHLVLDEVYSVDLGGARIKRSFGTALKVWDYDDRLRSGILLVAMLILVAFLPVPHQFWHVINDPSAYNDIVSHLW